MELRRTIRDWSTSRSGIATLVVVGEVVAGLLIFHAGVAYGERKVFHRLSFQRPHMMPEFGFLSHSFIPQDHGVVGTITGVSYPTFTVETRDGETEVVTMSSSTIVRSNTPGQPRANLVVGENVTILGEPGNSPEQFTARFINILPPR